MCGSLLRGRGYRGVGTRRVPRYQPCLNLDDPAQHPARRRRQPRMRKLERVTMLVRLSPNAPVGSAVVPG